MTLLHKMASDPTGLSAAARPALRDSVLVLEGDGAELHFVCTSSSTCKTFSVDPIARRIVGLLDGSRCVAELEAHLHDVPGYAAGYVNEVLDVLHEEDLLAAPVSAAEIAQLSLTERERYSRQLGLLEELAREAGMKVAGPTLQATLRSATVVVLGTGGLGSWLLTSLAAAGIGRLVVCDADTVELSNLNRQILFGTSDIGRLKTEVAAERLNALDPDIAVEPVNGIVRGPDDVASVADGADLVINCADRPSVAVTSDWVSAACLPRGVPHIVGGAYAYHVGSLGLTVLPGRTPCWDCAREEVGRQPATVLRGRESAGPSLAMFSAVSANLAAYDAVRLLLDLPPVTAGRLGEFDFRTLTLRWREIPNRCSHVRRPE
jgi:molybdopterin/thiamine biosynthesis adenylyltransferase